MSSVLVLGAGIGGLGAAIGLARSGHDVTIVERDEPPGTESGDEAFTTWDRRHVPQFRQAHAFTARARNLLLERAPDALERLKADGVEEINHFTLLAPPELHTPEDDAFTAILSRRPAFELALRKTAHDTPGITFRCPERATGLVLETNGGLTVRGLRLDGGDELRADVVVDASGRRSPVVGWLRDAGAEIPEEVEDCGNTYHTRYFRQHPDSQLPQAFLFAIRAELDGLGVIGFPGDHGTYGITLAVDSADEGLKALRHAAVWDAVAAAVPASAPWVDPANGTPLRSEIDTMAGHANVYRHCRANGAPAVRNVLLVGDSLSTTNPTYGWGASMALTYAFAAVDAINSGDDVENRYLDAVSEEAEGVFRESAAMDRLRLYRWRGEAVPEHDRAQAERQRLLGDGVAAGSLRDPVLGRAFLRRINLLDSPNAAITPEVREHAEATIRHLASKPPRATGVDRATIDKLIAAAG